VIGEITTVVSKDKTGKLGTAQLRPNGEAQPAARRVQRCEPPRAVGIRHDEKSQREGGRLQRGLGGAAGVAASQSAHISCNDFGSANARTGTAGISRAKP
jgi:hypothetical protein